jgi:DNA-binding MarR family transcriptional regulator
MSQDEFNTLLDFFKALANENRLKILGILAGRECSVEELSELLELKEPTVSHHLSKLKAIGLVEMRVEGNDHLHRLNTRVLQSMNKDVFTSKKMASLVDDLDYDAWEKKVLRNFLEGDRIRDIPVGYKKRLVLYKWLVSHFEEGRKYTEIEVNEIIQRYHPDYASVRRAFIDHGLMERKNAIYWRIEWQIPDLR